jgi:phospholipase/lecithinase/hemolysin
MPVGIWSAASRQKAIAAAATKVVVYANQHLTAVPYSRASKADQQAASEADTANLLRAEELAAWKAEAEQ